MASKYGNKRTEVNGILFDSKHEAMRWVELQYMQRAGLIKGLERQTKFGLIPPLKDDDGKVYQKAVYYKADFTYWEKQKDGSWRYTVEDAKGCRTDVYKLKKKMMRWQKGIEIREV